MTEAVAGDDIFCLGIATKAFDSIVDGFVGHNTVPVISAHQVV